MNLVHLVKFFQMGASVVAVAARTGELTLRMSDRLITDNHGVSVDAPVVLRPGEIWAIDCDFQDLLPDGVTISSATIVDTEGYATDPESSGQIVNVLVTIPAGLAQQQESFEVVATTSQGTTVRGLAQYWICPTNKASDPPYLSQVANLSGIIADESAMVAEVTFLAVHRTKATDWSVYVNDKLMLRPSEVRWVAVDLAAFLPTGITISSATVAETIGMVSDVYQSGSVVSFLVAATSELESNTSIEITATTSQATVFKPLLKTHVRAKDQEALALA